MPPKSSSKGKSGSTKVTLKTPSSSKKPDKTGTKAFKPGEGGSSKGTEAKAGSSSKGSRGTSKSPDRQRGSSRAGSRSRGGRDGDKVSAAERKRLEEEEKKRLEEEEKAKEPQFKPSSLTPEDKAKVTIEGNMVSIFNMDGVYKTTIEYKDFWFADIPGGYWHFKGFFMHDLHHPIKKHVMVAKGEEVELRIPDENDGKESDEDDW
jgi:hypothetical protein